MGDEFFDIGILSVYLKNLFGILIRKYQNNKCVFVFIF